MLKRRKDGVRVCASTLIAVATAFSIPAVDKILEEFSERPGSASLALNVRELHVPFEGLLSVPIVAKVASGKKPDQWSLAIQAALRVDMYPRFEGVLSVAPASQYSSLLELDGTYFVPFGAIGRAIDVTLLRGAAESSLQRFVRDVGHRVVALSHWTQQA